MDDAKRDLYGMDLSDAVWTSAPGGTRPVEIAQLPGGAVAMRDAADPEGPVLRFTPDEWTAFLQGARAGEFD